MAGWSFDRAADYYDATRGLPEPVLAAVTDLLAGELAERGPTLEIGVGTGRIALPLHDRGVDLVGTDIARPMLDRLVANAGGELPFPLVMDDAIALSFGDATFATVLASHVFHLILPWRRAVDEAMRVLRPDGVLVVDFGGGAPAPWNEGVKEVMARLDVHHVRPGVSVAADVSEHLGDRATARMLPPVTMSERRSLADDLDQWEHQLQSWTWQYPAEQMRDACDAARRWATGEGIDLDARVALENTITWWCFEKRPGGAPVG